MLAGQRPVLAGQRPVLAGQRPVLVGQRPVLVGQRPVLVLKQQGQASKLSEEQSSGLPRPEQVATPLEFLDETFSLRLPESVSGPFRHRSQKGRQAMDSILLQLVQSGREQTVRPSSLIGTSLLARSNRMTEVCMRPDVGVDPSNAPQKQD